MYTLDLGASEALTDDAFVGGFEGLTLPASGFRHPDHIRYAWICLREERSLTRAMDRVSEGIRRFATHNGAPKKYHETLTLGSVVLVHQRMHERDADDWPSFAAEHPDLLRWKDGAFFDHYDESVIASEVARRVFVLPTRTATKASEARP